MRDYMMKTQRGMTAIGWLTVLALIGFFVLLTLRLTPVYLEAYKVSSQLKSFKREPGITRKSVTEIRKMLQKRFDIDDIDRVDPRKAIKITKKDNVLLLESNYEIRQKIVGNIDVIVKFRDVVKIISN